MRVTGNNLQNACKLIFTISKDERNDPFFAQEQIIGMEGGEGGVGGGRGGGWEVVGVEGGRGGVDQFM